MRRLGNEHRCCCEMAVKCERDEITDDRWNVNISRYHMKIVRWHQYTHQLTLWTSEHERFKRECTDVKKNVGIGESVDDKIVQMTRNVDNLQTNWDDKIIGMIRECG